MKIYSTVAVLLLALLPSFAQLWHVRVDHQEQFLSEGATDIDKCGDGIIVSYGYQDEVGNLRFGCSLLNEQGDILAQSDYSKSSGRFITGLSNCGVLLSDGNMCYATAFEQDTSDIIAASLVKVSCQTDSIWTMTYWHENPEKSMLANACLEEETGDLILVGYSFLEDDQDIFIIKADSQGNLIWLQELGSETTAERSHSIFPTADGGYIIGGLISEIGFANDLYAVKVDSEGSFEWDFRIESEYSDLQFRVVEDENGDFIGVGRNTVEQDPMSYPLIVKFDDEGEIIWEKELSEIPQFSSGLAVIRLLSDGNFLVSGSVADNQYFSGTLTKFDSEGECIWSYEYQSLPEHHSFLTDVVELPGGEILACGLAQGSDEFQLSQDAWVLKLDSFGCLVPDCHVGIKEFEQKSYFNCNPNPVTDELNIITGDLTLTADSKIRIYDPRGVIVMTTGSIRSHSNHRMNFSSLSPGTYIITLESAGALLQSEKLVKF